MSSLPFKKPSPKQQEIIDNESPCLLVMGKPGSGKTMGAILKARAFLEKNRPKLKDYHKVLILTFSRTAVFQLLEKSKLLVDIKKIEINTYHAFFLHIVQQFGKYTGFAPGRIKLLLGGEREDLVRQGKNIIKENKKTNMIHFGEFCSHAISILQNSKSIQKCLWSTYPLVIVDEFQDTNEEQWEFIKLLTKGTRLICFAGPGQMIYRHLKANPQRLNHLREWRKSKEIILGPENPRDPSDYFVSLGENILKPNQKGFVVNEPGRVEFEAIQNFYAKGNHLNGHFQYKLKWKIKNYREEHADASIGVLCYTNEDANRISRAFQKKTPKGPQIPHRLIEDEEKKYYLENLIVHGWRCLADKNFEDTQEIQKYLQLFQTHGEHNLLDSGKLTEKRILEFINRTCEGNFESYISSFCQKFGGNAHQNLILSSRVEKLVDLFNEFKAINDREPTPLEFEKYLGNRRLQEAVREKYSSFKGTQVMTLHKSKGKEFDLVVLVHFARDPFSHRPKEEEQHRELLNVGITRARKKLIIFYPQNGCCHLIKELISTVKGKRIQNRVCVM